MVDGVSSFWLHDTAAAAAAATGPKIMDLDLSRPGASSDSLRETLVPAAWLKETEGRKLKQERQNIVAVMRLQHESEGGTGIMSPGRRSNAGSCRNEGASVMAESVHSGRGDSGRYMERNEMWCAEGEKQKFENEETRRGNMRGIEGVKSGRISELGTLALWELQ